jgi:hypothetical protein
MATDLTNIKFGKLIVIKRYGISKNGHATWLCLCDCGIESIKFGSNLIKGHTKSCGCLVGETIKKTTTTHGMRNTAIYSRWVHMMERCYKSYSTAYKNYGGRGITVDIIWHDFINFYNDMHNGFNENLQIDRIDVNGNYCKNNCRWVTQKINSRNRRFCKITEEIASEIRLSNDKTSLLMKKYNCCKSTINNIKANISWI